MKKIELKDIKESDVFSNKYIKRDFEEFIEGYDTADLDLDTDNCSCTLRDSDDNYVVINRYKDTIKAVKYTDYSKEFYTINDNSIIHISLVKKDNGVVYSIIKKEFAASKKYNNEGVLSDISEERYVLSRDKIMDIFGIEDLDNTLPNTLFIKVKNCYDDGLLYSLADHSSSFSSEINNSYVSRGRKKSYPTITYFNDTDVSRIYNLDGEDMLYRIFDLYKGVINPRCEKDILNIGLGFLSEDAFDLFGASGIRKHEESIVGADDDFIDYYEYLREFFERQFAYAGDFSLDRESILNVIGYKKYSGDVAKRIVSQRIGIPYEEFDQLDLDEQQRIIESVNGKKMGYDLRHYIDGIPLDRDHIVTMEDAEKRMDELCGFRGSINKIFIKFINRFKK